ncbi:unnamed protein product [Spirodela intermedia]|uniref:Uncharacterized protein n=1 Tax=Spirodela intermedia TaxID=51605 RepID=A0A7I8IG92_SPIIN|nr:unnamed protein product [Spirodela intermedia]CAA6656304.1 unnamed protein product [Spirodela intermedia]
MVVSARLDDSADGGQQQEALNFSVLRFTLGIPGLDESYLPRYIGLAFGSLIVLNHLLGSSDSPTPAQLRSEALGICLAAFSFALPYFGKFLKGTGPADRSIVPEGNTQIFAISEDAPGIQKEDLAWASYVILQNTNTISVLISAGDKLCIRGYWNVPEEASKAQILDLFRREIRETGLTGLKDPLYFPLGAGRIQWPIHSSWEYCPRSTFSAAAADHGARDPSGDGGGDVEGFVLLASNARYAYRDSDRAWIKVMADKFQGTNATCRNAVSTEISA